MKIKVENLLTAIAICALLAILIPTARTDSGIAVFGGNGGSGTATALRSATTDVNVSLSAAPSSGYVLTATSATAATWQAASCGVSGLTANYLPKAATSTSVQNSAWTDVSGTTTYTTTGASPTQELRLSTPDDNGTQTLSMYAGGFLRAALIWTTGGTILETGYGTLYARSDYGIAFQPTNGSTTWFKVDTAGMQITGGNTPTVSNTSADSCGTTSAAIAGNSNTGIVTVGATSGTSCTITFPNAAPTRRQCWASNESTGNLVRGVYVDTTHSKLDGTFVAGDVLAYRCETY